MGERKQSLDSLTRPLGSLALALVTSWRRNQGPEKAPQMTEQSQTRDQADGRSYLKNLHQFQCLQEVLPICSLFPTSGGSGRVQGMGVKKSMQASVPVLGTGAPTKVISAPSKKVYWASKHNRMECLPWAWPRIWLSAP